MISRKEITDLRVSRVMDDIRRDPCTNVKPLADRVGLSLSRLQHLFLEETGMSLGAFIGETRLDNAAELLCTTFKQIKEIAYDAGYRHPSSFVRAFKARYDVAPAQYRSRRLGSAMRA